MKRSIPQHAGKKKRRSTGPMITICFCLIAAVTALSMGIVLAKMISTTGGNTSAQIAAFILQAGGDEGKTLTIDYIGSSPYTADYSFTVSNTKAGKTSEVSMKYDVIVTLPQFLPDSIALKLNDGSIAPVIDGNTYTYSHAGVFQKGKLEEHNHILTFTTDSNIVAEDIRLEGITVTVRAEQID